MILRRLSQSLKEQNWTAIAVEFVLLVLGVFLGIQVANWNEERVERAQEKGLLVRLHEDFSEMVAGQTRDLRFLDQQLADSSVFFDFLGTLVELFHLFLVVGPEASQQSSLGIFDFARRHSVERTFVDRKDARALLPDTHWFVLRLLQ